ncbi:MAG: hypothetical protein E5Y73_28525 [Mesorhizobium sp.]|uniref:hypothetical protein n=1 Tax=Mesorhizobium sp. TaxID=1871066 RepID=UPI000FE5AF8E|nr:hypothetical protein [Mesorhizobium sp.]RWP24958.1 MAG: hypothetical protein EOR01_05380 [Mesorhizobium sp.]TIL85781.1 MAG: hypothetical protein E5Y73_28525 [Mesorhizobium sp.]
MNVPKFGVKKTIEMKQAELRQEVFGSIDPAHTWSRKTAKGFTTIPRTMPLLGAIMDGMSGKGKPVSTTYLELWCRSNDDGFVTLSKQVETAYASGFSGPRAVSTWKERVRKLEALEFLRTKPGVSGNLHYVQLWNPYKVIKFHKAKSTPGFRQELYNVLFERVQDIGASDLD